MKWLLRLWLSVNVLVLVLVLVLAQAILAQETPSSGGELAMVIYLLNMPSPILTGIDTNTLGHVINNTSQNIHLVLIWMPFFIMGAIQWRLLRWLIQKISGR